MLEHIVVEVPDLGKSDQKLGFIDRQDRQKKDHKLDNAPTFIMREIVLDQTIDVKN